MSIRTKHLIRMPLALASGLLLLAQGCSGDTPTGGGGTMPPPPPAAVASITLSPDSTALYPAQNVTLTATAKDASGNPLQGRTITWALSDTSLAQLSASGATAQLVAKKVGAVTVTATSEQRSGTARVLVRAVPVASIAVSPSEASVIAGRTAQLVATARDSAGGVLTDRAVAWTTNDSSVATVSSSGLVRGVAVGTATITASVEGRSASATLTVQAPPPVASVRLDLASDMIVAGSTTEVIHATALSAQGDTLAGRAVAWSSSNPSVATVDGAGRITARAAGTTTLVATIEGRTAAMPVTVESRTRYERTLDMQWAFIDGSDRRMPAWNPNGPGYEPRPGDTREVIVVDETFSVAPGREVVWKDKIVKIRPKARRDIEIRGTLHVRNSLLLWEQTEHQQTRFVVKQGGVLRIENSYSFQTNQFWVNWDFESGATVSFNHFQGDPWTSIHGAVQYTSRNASTTKLTIFPQVANASIDISDASQLWFELFLPAGTHRMSFPKQHAWSDVQLPGIWTNTQIAIRNSWVFRTDPALSPNVHATIVDSPEGFGIGWTISSTGSAYVECELRGLGEPGNNSGVLYADKTWSLPCINSSLTLRNSRLVNAWPNTLGAVRLRLYDSNLADLRNFGSGAAPHAILEIYNSTMQLLSTSGSGMTYAENSKVWDDVQVNGTGSVIYGFGLTRVDGAPLPVLEESGGRYVNQSRAGAPWH